MLKYFKRSYEFARRECVIFLVWHDREKSKISERHSLGIPQKKRSL